MDLNAEYVRLKKAGYGRWGGESFARRREGWMKAVTRLMQNDSFPKPPAHLLELGSGNGVMSELFARQGYTIDGVEISKEAVLWARELFEAADLSGSFRQGDVCSMPFYDDDSYDAVLDGNCLHCLIGSERSKCVAEVRRIMRSNGLFVISTMCGRPKSEAALARFDDQTCCLLDERGQPYRTLRPADEVLEEVREAGFDVSHCEINENAWWDHMSFFAVAR